MASIRRLAAILAADVVGYSRLMGADEEGTHERLKSEPAPFCAHDIQGVSGADFLFSPHKEVPLR